MSRINSNSNTDQQYSRDKKLPKIKNSGQTSRRRKSQNDKAIQCHAKTNFNPLTDKTKASKKVSKRAKKDKKKKIHKNKQDRQEGSSLAIRSNTQPLFDKNWKNFTQITYFSCNKKGHYLKNCIVLVTSMLLTANEETSAKSTMTI